MITDMPYIKTITTDIHKITVVITAVDSDHRERKQTLHIVSQITEGLYRLMFAMTALAHEIKV
jgi:hypothetical protein